MVLVGENHRNAPIDQVAIDNVQAADDVTTHLVAQGCRRIAFMGTRNRPSQTGQERQHGYQRALTRAALQPRVDLLQDVPEWDRPDGHSGAARLLDRVPDIDAIVCANDLLASGALSHLRQVGRRVPDDIAVTGWDNVPDSAYTAPPLTTIDAHVEQIATHAVDQLIKRINDPGSPVENIVVEHRLVVRDSSRVKPDASAVPARSR